jgi:hypothetical protein
MAEPKMNPNSQEQMMLVQSFEQMADAVGAEIPVNLSSESAAVKAGKRMSGELQRMLAEGSMSLMNQLNPEMMPENELSYQVDDSMERMSPEMMESLRNSGQITEDEYTYMVDGQPQAMAPSQMGGMQSSGTITPNPTPVPSNVMSMEEAVDAGLVTPTRPRMRPAAPMQSPRPQARPMR